MDRAQRPADRRISGTRRPLSPLTLASLTAVPIAGSLRGGPFGLAVGALLLVGVSTRFRVGASVARASTLLVLPLLAFLAVLHLVTPGVVISDREFWLGYAAAGSRIVLLVATFQLLRFALNPSALRAELLSAGSSPVLVQALIGSLFAVADLRQRLRRVIDSQRARGLPVSGSLRNRVRALVTLTGPFFIGALLDADRRAMAIEARGLRLATAPVLTFQEVSISRDEHWLRATALLLALALLLVRT